MLETLARTLEELEQEGVLGPYALGGAFALLHHAEPMETYDVDILTLLPAVVSGAESKNGLHDAFRRRGHATETLEGVQYIRVERFPVQILAVAGELEAEAIRSAVRVRYGGTELPVVRLEHLIALMLKASRGKDRRKFDVAAEAPALDPRLLKDILARHHLAERWSEWGGVPL